AAAAKDKSGDFYQNKLALAQYFVTRILPELDSRIKKVEAGSDLLMNFSEDYFTNQA
ncbi:MAG: acyl-CoA dehydrogenase C-terminal domain-containing protein, partial [Acinetobacter sp.]|nr:acyl-CoA dehydrogenase C-terminal domain-containing protein [Acinetobacter sp.]